eukprot:NODE_6775_length_344_cov_29.705085_g6048_i0.p2 GENE.NODE_6775_length_344_cov_29.705085_g6048_i0~~NODE_6775_length_344_cov_29.705085_g6048_i0.p2  ORF type:complete len:60 (+),score=5.31 NODE_6775_length_344_cov_29.705085_g6048_i0:91-270(+)
MSKDVVHQEEARGVAAVSIQRTYDRSKSDLSPLFVGFCFVWSHPGTQACAPQHIPQSDA